jgi:TRAP-type mannitol/chloroaromatic compound transport system permease small subunit
VGDFLESYLKVVAIDKLSVEAEKFFSYLVYPWLGGTMKFARYLFHAPTDWACDVTHMLYGSVFMLGAAYALLNKGISDGMFYGRPPKARENRRHPVPVSVFPRDDLVFLGRSRLCSSFLGDERKSRQ